MIKVKKKIGTKFLGIYIPEDFFCLNTKLLADRRKKEII